MLPTSVFITQVSRIHEGNIAENNMAETSGVVHKLQNNVPKIKRVSNIFERKKQAKVRLRIIRQTS